MRVAVTPRPPRYRNRESRVSKLRNTTMSVVVWLLHRVQLVLRGGFRQVIHGSDDRDDDCRSSNTHTITLDPHVCLPRRSLGRNSPDTCTVWRIMTSFASEDWPDASGQLECPTSLIRASRKMAYRPAMNGGDRFSLKRSFTRTRLRRTYNHALLRMLAQLGCQACKDS